MAEKILFVDRDGTLIEEPSDLQVDALDKVRLCSGVIAALRDLIGDGYRLVMVSNQDGLGTASYPRETFEPAQEFILQLFASQGIKFDPVFICPHLPEADCDCRKPRTGLLTQFLAATTIDLTQSAVIGDRDTDLELAANLGIKGLLYSATGNYDQSWAGIRQALKPSSRRAEILRETNETRIRVALDLDNSESGHVSTGIGFYDHMLEQIAKHGGFHLNLSCEGDLHIDEHHTVEDSSICLGQALRKALGDKRGIDRYGFLLPMDEAEAKVSIDLSGRPYFVFKGEFASNRVGGMPTELVPHFFHSLADSLGAALHIEVTGANTHHMVESCFKAVGRALRQAIRQEGSELPSTKGLLA